LSQTAEKERENSKQSCNAALTRISQQRACSIIIDFQRLLASHEHGLAV
jgi:hypothetical protein